MKAGLSSRLRRLEQKHDSPRHLYLVRDDARERGLLAEHAARGRPEPVIIRRRTRSLV